ncbi:MAG: hypothetical protein MUO63_16155 [Desulfobulbaceae bacterium]|nr:hypothetical protein [Desulfobulbaceae bacterium]
MKDEILKFIGSVIAYGGGGAVVAYGIFVFFGKKWIESKFSQKLEEYKNEQRKELENFKLKINTLFNRITKIHEKEIDVLPQCWSKLHDAKNIVSNLVSPLQSYPDFDKMNETQIRASLKNTLFEEFQIEELIKQRDKNKYYQENIFWHRLHEAKKKFSDFHLYTTKNRIFLSNDLKNLFTEADDLMWEVLTGKEVGQECKDYKMMNESYRKLRDNIDKIIEKIESHVQERLHYDKA